MTASAADPSPLHATSWSPRRIAILGVGLLGGSFGLAIQRRYHDATLIGVSRSLASRDAALRCGAVHEAIDNPQQACRGADLVVIATPVDRIAPLAILVTGVCAEDALITDLGSTKASIVSEVHQHATAGNKFVGSHPIAGSEKTGAEHARADLFESRPVVLTPIDGTDAERLRRAAKLWQSLGARVVTMTPQQHDRAVASISHVPHLIASALANLVDDSCNAIVGSGWLDLTRVASGDPDMWTAICQQNRAAIIAGLDQASGELQKFRDALSAGDAQQLHALLAAAKVSRDALAER